jgi:hypothetical protein
MIRYRWAFRAAWAARGATIIQMPMPQAARSSLYYLSPWSASENLFPGKTEAHPEPLVEVQFHARRSCIGVTGILWFRRLHTLV